MQKGRLVSVFAKLLLCLVMPMQASATSDYVQCSTALMSIVWNDTNPAIVMRQDAPLTFLLLGVFSIPGILFYYIQTHRPADQSVTKIFILASILMTPSVIGFFTSLILSFLAMALAYDLYSMVISPLVTVVTLSTWSTAFLLVIPFLMRQVRLHKVSTNRDRNSSTSLSTQEMIAILLGICVFILPTAIIQFLMLGSRESIMDWVIVSSIWTCQVNSQAGFVVVYLSSTGSLIYLFTPILAGLNTLFAYYVMRYLCHRTSRMKCIQVGVFTAIGTTLAVLIPELFSPRTFLPTPVMLLVGALVVFAATPVEVADYLWEDVPHEMWFYDRESTIELPEGESIRVPLSYVLYSKLRSPRRQRIRSEVKGCGEEPIQEDTDTSETRIEV
jgi:hypothetical protein